MSLPSLAKHENGVWYVHWTDGRRSKRESTGTREVSAAKAYLSQFLINGSEAQREPETAFTIAELWTVYDAQHVEHVAAPDAIRFAWKNLAPHFGPLKAVEVDQRTVDAYERLRTTGNLGRQVKPATVRKELAALRAGLNWCADPKRKIIPKDAVPLFDLPPEGEARDRWLRHEEIQRLLTAARATRGGDRLSRVERFLWIALETAARKAAILELTWDRVDFETGVIHLSVPGRRLTKKRRAAVPISKALLPVLQRAHDEREGDLVMDHGGDIWSPIQAVAAKAGFGAAERAPRPTGAKPKATGISPHVLRHTAATHMARRGVPLWIIAKILGNTLAMVEKVYAKHCPDDLRDGVNMISNGVLLSAE